MCEAGRESYFWTKLFVMVTGLQERKGSGSAGQLLSLARASSQVPSVETLTVLRLHSIIREVIMTEEDYQGNKRVLERCIVMIDFYDSVHLMGKKMLMAVVLPLGDTFVRRQTFLPTDESKEWTDPRCISGYATVAFRSPDKSLRR